MTFILHIETPERCWITRQPLGAADWGQDTIHSQEIVLPLERIRSRRQLICPGIDPDSPGKGASVSKRNRE